MSQKERMLISIKGATGTCRNQINGTYRVTGCDSSGYATYDKLSDDLNAVCIEHKGGSWQVKLAVDKGRNVCFACCPVDSKRFLEACSSHLWMVSVDGNTAVPHPGAIVEDLAIQADSKANAQVIAKTAALAEAEALAKAKAEALAKTEALETKSVGVISIGTPEAVSDLSPYDFFLDAYGTGIAAQAPQYPDELLAAVRKTIFGFCHKLFVSEAEAVRFFKSIQAEALDHKEEFKENIAESAVLIWTSTKRLQLAPSKSIEFCSLLNCILREHPDLLPSACVVVRGINLLCVMRREETALPLPYPPSGESHRGGGLPLEHVQFFVVGKKFRVPMFLATSFDEDVAYKCE
jgi:hypothetical protein